MSFFTEQEQPRLLSPLCEKTFFLVLDIWNLNLQLASPNMVQNVCQCQMTTIFLWWHGRQSHQFCTATTHYAISSAFLKVKKFLHSYWCIMGIWSGLITKRSQKTNYRIYIPTQLWHSHYLQMLCQKWCTRAQHQWTNVQRKRSRSRAY